MDNDYSSIKYANIIQPPTLKDKKEWFGIYEGVRFEINNFKFGPTDKEDRWTHYISVNLDKQLSKENADKLWLKPDYRKLSETSNEYLAYDYFDSPIGEITFHGGCTYYSKVSGPDDKDRIIKVGCDYQHYWDMGKSYDLSYVYTEVQATIESFVKLFGPIKIGSNGDGKYRFIDEFTKDPSK